MDQEMAGNLQSYFGNHSNNFFLRHVENRIHYKES